jgi:hypothetical protein
VYGLKKEAQVLENFAIHFGRLFSLRNLVSNSEKGLKLNGILGKTEVAV